MYDWVLAQAHSKHGTRALFLLSFAESSFFPVPPDVLQIALTLERRSRAFFYAGVSSVASVLGGVAGYAIGRGLWAAVDQFFFRYVFAESVFKRVEGLYQTYDFWCVFIAAFTPIPYKVFTIAGGVFQISLPMFLLASAVGRSGRFFLVALLLWWFGPPIKTFIDRYFNLISVVFTVLLVGFFVLLKYV
jgi:membrane protein YqaA with SNARE-associated domain